jgi:hypothetical protein
VVASLVRIRDMWGDGPKRDAFGRGVGYIVEDPKSNWNSAITETAPTIDNRRVPARSVRACRRVSPPDGGRREECA